MFKSITEVQEIDQDVSTRRIHRTECTPFFCKCVCFLTKCERFSYSHAQRDRADYCCICSVISAYLSVCRLDVLVMNPAKTAEPIEVQFGLWTRVGPRNHVLGGKPGSPTGMGTF